MVCEKCRSDTRLRRGGRSSGAPEQVMNNLYLHPAAVKRIKEIEAATHTKATVKDDVVQLLPVLYLQDGESVAEFHVRDNRSIECSTMRLRPGH